MGKIKDLTSARFGRLTVIEFAGIIKHDARWKCKCDCGNETIVSGHSLRRFQTKSCGCYQRDRMIKHGMKFTRLYEKWNHMQQRCDNPNNPSYERYGQRGIMICDEWRDFNNFAKWALSHGYKDKLSIDRIDVNGDYTPENCRFANATQQANNRTNNHLIEFNGEIKTIAEWAKSYNLKYGTLLARINDRKWSIEQALNTPVKGR